MVEIRRKRIRRKYYIVAIEKGKIIEKKRWGKLKVPEARGIYKSNNTFEKDISKRYIKSRGYNEYTAKPSAFKRQKRVPFRVVVSALMKDGTIIDASSMSMTWRNTREAEDSAMTNLYERISQEYLNTYDADEGKKLDKQIISIRRTIIYVK